MPRGKAPNGIDTDGANRPPRKPKGRNYRERAEFTGWVNINIPTADKAKVAEFGQGTEYGAALADMIVAGHKLSLAYDPDEETFVAMTFQNDIASPCAGLMVSQRSDDIWRALLKLVYVHAELLPPDYSGLAGNGGGNW